VTEAFGVAVAEGQAMGLPVVCSDAGGLPENVADGVTGFVVPRRDPFALADGIARLAADPHLRRAMGLAARQRAESALSLARQLDCFEALYRQVLSLPRTGQPTSLRQARSASRRRRVEALREKLGGQEGPNDSLRDLVWRREVVEQVHAFVAGELPPGTRVLVVSRGDEDIVDFPGHLGEHFPQTEDGIYMGHHPADSADAIARLETLCGQGAHYLVIPGTSAWWLDHYAEFAQHLEDRYTRLAAKSGAYIAYALAREDKVAAA
jgi:hypothetical protein